MHENMTVFVAERPEVTRTFHMMIYAHYKTNDHLIHLNAMTYEARHHLDSFKARPLVLTLDFCLTNPVAYMA